MAPVVRSAGCIMKSWLSSLQKRGELLAARLNTDADARVNELIASGQSLEDAGQPAEALALYRQALELNPRSARAHLNIGNAQKLLKDGAGALTSYRRAVEIDPDNFSALFNLGNLLLAARVFPLAESAYREALRLRPDWVEALIGLGCALEGSEAIDEAAAAYRRALALSPGHAGAALNLSDLQTATGDGAGAEETLRECLKIVPGLLPLMQKLADLAHDAGRLSECVAILRDMVGNNSDLFFAHCILLFQLNFVPEVTAAELLQEHRRFGVWLEDRVAAAALPSAVPGDAQRRLRVGYVSPDLHRHSVANFLAPVLGCHDRRAVEVFCYSIDAGEDEITAELKSRADHWCAAAAWDDDAIARAIQSDQIDILVDLAGHTGGNRIGVFARKPAPVQFTWLGYPATTGLKRIDYRLCDAHTDPQGEAERWQTEIPMRMPDSQWCYEPFGEMPAPSSLPRLTRGYWTFGSFNNGRKIGERTLNVWAKILLAFPQSRLRLCRLRNKVVENWALNALEERGIARECVEICRYLPVNEYFGSFADIDIALDSFPYNGTTTSCESLLMGVPVLTVAGQHSASRVGISILNAIGLPDWIAKSEEELPALAMRKLEKPEAIARLRAELPGRMRASPLMDGPRFTKNLEIQYRRAWRRWCEGGALS
jgi:protein O-GlcNAc transferase